MIDRLRAITGKRTTPGTWWALGDADARAAGILGPDGDEFIRVSWNTGRDNDPESDAAAIVAMDHTYEALLAVAEAAREYVELHDTMNYPETAAMYPARVRDALAVLDARIAEVTK